MQFKGTFRALSQRLGNRGQHGAALCAARNILRARHLHRTRAKGVLTRGLFPWAIVLRFLPLSAAVLVSVLAIFSVGQTCCSVENSAKLRMPHSLASAAQVQAQPELYFAKSDATIR